MYRSLQREGGGDESLVGWRNAGATDALRIRNIETPLTMYVTMSSRNGKIPYLVGPSYSIIICIDLYIIGLKVFKN